MRRIRVKSYIRGLVGRRKKSRVKSHDRDIQGDRAKLFGSSGGKFRSSRKYGDWSREFGETGGGSPHENLSWSNASSGEFIELVPEKNGAYTVLYETQGRAGDMKYRFKNRRTALRMVARIMKESPG